MELFGRNYETVGSSTSDFCILTRGLLKLKWGNKFIDLVKDGKLNTDIIHSGSVKSSSGIYVDGEDIYIVSGNKKIKLKVDSVENIGTSSNNSSSRSTSSSNSSSRSISSSNSSSRSTSSSISSTDDSSSSNDSTSSTDDSSVNNLNDTSTVEDPTTTQTSASKALSRTAIVTTSVYTPDDTIWYTDTNIITNMDYNGDGIYKITLYYINTYKVGDTLYIQFPDGDNVYLGVFIIKEVTNSYLNIEIDSTSEDYYSIKSLYDLQSCFLNKITYKIGSIDSLVLTRNSQSGFDVLVSTGYTDEQSTDSINSRIGDLTSLGYNGAGIYSKNLIVKSALYIDDLSIDDNSNNLASTKWVRQYIDSLESSEETILGLALSENKLIPCASDLEEIKEDLSNTIKDLVDTQIDEKSEIFATKVSLQGVANMAISNSLAIDSLEENVLPSGSIIMFSKDYDIPNGWDIYKEIDNLLLIIKK